MGLTKRIIEEQWTKNARATTIAIDAEVLARCEWHGVVYDNLVDRTDAYKLGNSLYSRGLLGNVFLDRMDMTDSIKAVIEQCPDECWECERMRSDD